MTFLSLIAIALLGLISAIVARGGLILRGLGIAVVTRDGHEASRLRAFGRAAIAWSPALILPFSLWFGGVQMNDPLWLGGPCLVLAAGAVWAVWSPTRGVQDRIARTWLVPR